jgi:16S rRNA (guanine1207-N2)-methyltransferase
LVYALFAADSVYDEWQEIVVRLGGNDVAVVSKPGFANWNAITPSTALMAAAVDVPPNARIVVAGCGHGALGVTFARRASGGQVWLIDTSVVAVEAARRTLRANDVGNASVVVEATDVVSWRQPADLVVIECDKDRGLNRRFLVEAHRVLEPGGFVYLAGANNQGIKSVVDDGARLFGNVAIVDVRMKHRVARLQKLADGPDAPAWAAEPGIAPGTWVRFAGQAQGIGIELASLPGVFSHGRIDPATHLLGESLAVPAGARVVDLGCGSGAIGLWAARMGATRVDLVDANLLAVASAREGAKTNGAVNVRVLSSDVLGAVREESYDLVATNPPFHTGRDVDYHVAVAFIEQAAAALAPGGEFVLVANRFIPYERLLEGAFGGYRLIAANSRYRLLAATRAR